MLPDAAIERRSTLAEQATNAITMMRPDMMHKSSTWSIVARLPFERVRKRLARGLPIRRLSGLALLGFVLLVLALAITRILGPRQSFTAFELPYVQDFSDVDIKSWFSDRGMWALREEMLAQTANLEQPANIFVPYRLDAAQPYHLSVYLTLAKNTRAVGVNFNAQYPNLTTQLHRVMINRSEGGDLELAAGYTDSEGNFVNQVTVPLDTDTQKYRLDLYVLDKTYTVQLNGQNLIERRPLFYPNGLIGFYSLGPARFDTLKITAAIAEQPHELVYVSDFDSKPGGAGWVPFSGEWKISQGELVQANPAAQDAGIGYQGGAFENYVLRVSLRHLIGLGGGLLFNMASPYQLNDAHMVRYSDQTNSLFWGYFDAAGMFVRQGAQALPDPGNELRQIRVYSGEGSYDIFVDDRLVAHDVPLQRTHGHIGLITSRSSVAYTLVEAFPLFDNTPLVLVKTDERQPTPRPPAAQASPKVQATAKTVVTATPVPATTPLVANSPLITSGSAKPWRSVFRGDLRASGWQVISGQWRFADQALIQDDTSGYDLSVVYTDHAFRNYALEVALSHRSGNGAGVLFNMPYTNRLTGAYMFRYSDRRPGGVFWGYYDETGKFVGQGYANVDPPGTNRHVIRIVSGDTTYSIFLDGILLAGDIPIINGQNFGYIGLITARSTSVFESVSVGAAERATSTLATPTPAVMSPLTPASSYSGESGFPDQRIISGNWDINQGAFTQVVPNPADYILNTGIYASSYTIQADITLPDTPDAGGGFMIHMPERSRKSGATIVRFIRGGEGIFWGNYDEAGIFRGRGSAKLVRKLQGGSQLRLVVRGNSVDVFVDDQTIASGIRLPRAEGWISLVAYGGPVTLANVEVTVGLEQ